LPFQGSVATDSSAPAFSVTNTGNDGGGILGIGGTGIDYSPGGGFGVYGQGGSSTAVDANPVGSGCGVFGQGGASTSAISDPGVGGHFFGGSGSGFFSDAAGVYALGGVGIVAQTTLGIKDGFGGVFEGNVQVDGVVSQTGAFVKIDHPLDPANQYLHHSFVQSSDMLSIYNGNVTTDQSGSAVVTLPEWFESLNRDFCYQLTVIGQFAQAMVASKILNHVFVIKTDKPLVEVSWQVTGIRQDAWANARRILTEVTKDPSDQGHYLYPELFGHEGEPSIPELHYPRPPVPKT